MKKALILFLILGLPPLIYIFYVTFAQNHYIKLPIYGERKVITKIEDEKEIIDTIYHTIEFELKNQKGKIIHSESLKNKFYVANFIYTSENVMSKNMTQQMFRVQDSFKDNDLVRLVSFTVNPEIDDVETLKKYGEANEINPERWHLLTGDRKEIETLAEKQFLLEDENLQKDDFFSTNKVVLIDYEGRIRGTFECTDNKDVDDMMGALRLLRIEFYNENPQY